MLVNLESETFEEMPFPENLGKPSQLNLTELGECLCLRLGYVADARNKVLDHVDIWVMKDYGVKESWGKLFSVEQLEGHQHFSYLRPISFSVTGREVLLEMDHRKSHGIILRKRRSNVLRLVWGWTISNPLSVWEPLSPYMEVEMKGWILKQQERSLKLEYKKVSECIFYFIFLLYCCFSLAMET